MEFITIIIIAFGLSLDCLGIAIINSMAPEALRPGTKLKVALSFALAHAIMIFGGYHLGRTLLAAFIDVGYWFAFAVLVFIGLKMFISNLKTNPMTKAFDVNNPKTILGLSIATSIDALVAGVSLPFLHYRLDLSMFFVAIIIFAMTFGGMQIGKHFGFKAGKLAGAIGGLIIIGIGTANLLINLL